MTGCTGQQRVFHKAEVGEIMVVVREFSRMRMVGNRDEIACIPHEGCRLEIQETAASTDPQVKQLLPLDEITYIQVRFLKVFRRDLFLLSNGREVELWKLEGFKLRLMSPEIPRPPREEDVLKQAKAHGLAVG